MTQSSAEWGQCQASLSAFASSAKSVGLQQAGEGFCRRQLHGDRDRHQQPTGLDRPTVCINLNASQDCTCRQLKAPKMSSSAFTASDLTEAPRPINVAVLCHMPDSSDMQPFNRLICCLMQVGQACLMNICNTRVRRTECL